MCTATDRYRYVFGYVTFFCGLVTFLCGFLLNRSELHWVSEFSQKVPYNRQQHNLSSGRVVFILADGLSYTFVRPESEAMGNVSRFQMPFVTRMLSAEQASRLKLFHFMADPPTTTLQRLKAMMTGSMPTFVDAGSNFGSSELVEDNLIRQWNRAGRRILFVGDDTWMGLFPSGFSEAHPYPSFNVRDLDTVDNAVHDYVLSQLSDNATEWDVLIGHLLGVDHCGHTYGPNHPEMTRKLRELDQLIRRIVKRLRADDLLIVAGDHGMTASGDHGGDSLLELDAALLVYRPQGFTYRPPHTVRSHDRLAQIDLVPTLAFLTGVPVPYSNLGVLVRELMPSAEAFRAGLADNFVQMINYTVQYHLEIGEFPLPNDQYDLASLIHRFRDHNRSELVQFSHRGELDTDQMWSVLQALQTTYREHWTRFDVPRMWLGGCLMLSSLILMFCFIRPTLTVLLILVGQLFAAALTVSGIWNWQFASDALVVVSIFGTLLIAITSVIVRREPFVPHPSIGLVILLALSYMSNSYLVNEVRVVMFLMQTLVLGRCARDLTRNPGSFWMFAAAESFGLAILLRLSPLFEVCREESYVGSVCRPQTDPWLARPLAKLTLDEAYSLASFRIVTATLVLGVALVGLRRWLQRLGLFTAWNGTRLAVQLITPIGLILVTSCWILDVAQVALPEAKVAPFSASSLHLIRVWCARLLLISLACAALLLLHRPLLDDCHGAVPTGQQRRSTKATLHETKPVYTGWILITLVQLPVLALLLFLNEVHVVSLLLIPVAILLYQFSTVCRFEHSVGDTKADTTGTDLVSRYLRHASAWHVAVFLCLLDSLSFYLTGHQPTIAGIPWDAAFAAYAGDHTTNWLPALMVLVHLFAGSLLVAACVPLCLTGPLTWRLHVHRGAGDWKRRWPVTEMQFCAPRGPSATSFDQALERLCWRFFLTKAILTFGCVLSTGVLRRHLMVWKIFAPRLVFSVVSLLMSGCALVLIYSLVVLCIHRAAALRHHALGTVPSTRGT